MNTALRSGREVAFCLCPDTIRKAGRCHEIGTEREEGAYIDISEVTG